MDLRWVSERMAIVLTSKVYIETNDGTHLREPMKS